MYSILQGHLNSVIICKSSDGLDAVRRSEELKPDLVLLDIGLPKLNEPEMARQVRKLARGTKILLLRSSDGPELLHEAMTIGGRGWVAKSEAARNVLATVRAVLPDEHYFGRGFSPLVPQTPDTSARTHSAHQHEPSPRRRSHVRDGPLLDHNTSDLSQESHH